MEADKVPTASASSSGGSAEGEEPKKPTCRICCACPETRKVRDECVVKYGEEACVDKIEAHKMCLRKEGFNV